MGADSNCSVQSITRTGAVGSLLAVDGGAAGRAFLRAGRLLAASEMDTGNGELRRLKSSTISTQDSSSISSSKGDARPVAAVEEKESSEPDWISIISRVAMALFMPWPGISTGSGNCSAAANPRPVLSLMGDGIHCAAAVKVL